MNVVLVEEQFPPEGTDAVQWLLLTTLPIDTTEQVQQIVEYYCLRWQIELNLRSLKIVLQMDHLRCKEPHRVRNELYMHLLAYNLIRQVMGEAALKSGVCHHEISFKGTMQTLNQFLPMLPDAVSLDHWYDSLLEAIATHIVADRPDRFEPRCRKRRPKKFKNLREHRPAYKTRLRSRS